MKIYKSFFIITLFTGLIILAVGVYLKITNQFSAGLTSTKFSGTHYGAITGTSGIILGIFILLSSIWAYRMYKEEKKKFDKMK
jgi:Ca2+/Na+ antiporter